MGRGCVGCLDVGYYGCDLDDGEGGGGGGGACIGGREGGCGNGLGGSPLSWSPRKK